MYFYIHKHKQMFVCYTQLATNIHVAMIAYADLFLKNEASVLGVLSYISADRYTVSASRLQIKKQLLIFLNCCLLVLQGIVPYKQSILHTDEVKMSWRSNANFLQKQYYYQVGSGYIYRRKKNPRYPLLEGRKTSSFVMKLQ